MAALAQNLQAAMAQVQGAAEALAQDHSQCLFDVLDHTRLAISALGCVAQAAERQLLVNSATVVGGTPFLPTDRTPSQEIMLAIFHTLDLPGHLQDAEVVRMSSNHMDFIVRDKDGRTYQLIPVYQERL